MFRLSHKIKYQRPNYKIIKRHVTNDYNFFGGNLSDNLKNIGDDLKNKKDIVLNVSSDVTLDNTLKIFKMVEDKIRKDNLDHVEINVTMALGPVSVSMSKKILINE